MPKNERATAIIGSPQYGVDERGVLCLRFIMYISPVVFARAIIDASSRVETILKEARVSNVTQLAGLPCWVETADDNIVFLKMWSGQPWTPKP